MIAYHAYLNSKMKNVFGHLLVLVVIVVLMGRGANRLQLLLVSVLTKFCINNVTVCYPLSVSVSDEDDYLELKQGKDDLLLCPFITLDGSVKVGRYNRGWNIVVVNVME